MPEYRAMRERWGFLELCKNPQAAAEVTLQPVERLGVDAAILFADILLVLEPLGVGLEFARGDGPHIARRVQSAADVERLPRVAVDDAVGFVFETVARARKALAERVPLIGFAGAPFTLASYLIEGGASRDFLRTKRFMRAERPAWHTLLGKLGEITAAYLNGQIAAGAPIIHFGVGTATLLPLMREAGGDVIGLDWRVELGAAWERLGPEVAVQGNLDPAVLLSNPAEIRTAARHVLDAAARRPGHVFNLGHGIHQETPVDNVKALVDIVHELSAR